MAKLSKTWLTDRHIDLEFKSYLLLGYLQDVQEHFEEKKLYPDLAELIEHYREALKLKHSRNELQDNFPKELSGFNIENFRLEYEKLVNDDSLFEEVLRTAEFSLPRLDALIREGRQLYEYVESRLHIEPVGLVPLNCLEGYLFLQNSCTDVYRYQVTLFENSLDKFRSIHTAYITSYPVDFVHSYSSIKSELIQSIPDIPNPATYVIQSEISIPLNECFLPIAKRLLIRHISVS